MLDDSFEVTEQFHSSSWKAVQRTQ